MPGFLKSYPDPAVAAEAARRTAVLRAAGVTTPAVLSHGGTTIVFERIDGTRGAGVAAGDYTPALRALAPLHSTAVPDLPRHDPFLRIRPRIGLATAPEVRAVLSEPAPLGTAVLHGDFHPGQLIEDPNGTVWVVDLDDLAIGPPEADLANLAAHRATSGPPGGLKDRLGRAEKAIAAAWRGRIRPDLFAVSLRIALVRRHLKLREAGRPDHEAEVVAAVAQRRESANFSIL